MMMKPCGWSSLVGWAQGAQKMGSLGLRLAAPSKCPVAPIIANIIRNKTTLAAQSAAIHSKPSTAARVASTPAFFDEDSLFDDELEYATPAPTNAASTDAASIKDLPVSETTKRQLTKRGISSLFPIQTACLQPILEGKDLIGRAKTGTGKTLAFALPLVERLLKERTNTRGRRAPLALILEPTRELANQVATEIMTIAPNFDITTVYGGVSMSAQMDKLARGTDIVVGTPGRVIDLLERTDLDLSQIKILVLDEADHMLDIGFEDAMNQIMAGLPKQRQTLLFSATVPPWVREVSRKYLSKHVTVDLVGEEGLQVPSNVVHKRMKVSPTGRAAAVARLLAMHPDSQCIVFTQTKSDATQLASSPLISSEAKALHGDIPQATREATLRGFKSRQFRVLVATDVAARGLDIPAVDLVIQLQAPQTVNTYIHRAGRCGRAGRQGTAYLLYEQQDYFLIPKYEQAIGTKLQEEKVSEESIKATMDVSLQAALDTLSKLKLSEDTVKHFLPKAEELFQQKSHKALAEALAYIGGAHHIAGHKEEEEEYTPFRSRDSSYRGSSYRGSGSYNRNGGGSRDFYNGNNRGSGGRSYSKPYGSRGNDRSSY